MGSRTTITRAVAVLTGGLAALTAVGLATAAPAESPELGPVPALRPLERLAAIPSLAERAMRPPRLGHTRSFAAPVARREPPRPRAAFPLAGAAPDYGAADARFGANRAGHEHEGQDLFAPAGTPLVAIRDGRVVEKGDDGGRGNYVAIFSPAAHETYVYLHMREPSPLEPGRRVRAGARVGRVGCTGSCWGDHLHLEVRRGGGTQAPPVDPLPLLQRLDRG